MKDEDKTKEQLIEELTELRRRDAAERRRSEEALRTSEAQLSNAMKIAKLGHWEYDVAEDVFTFNDHFFAIFRTTAEQVGGYTMPSARYADLFVHPDDRDVVAREVRLAVESADPLYSRQLEHRIVRADGEAGHIAVRFFVVKDGQGRTIRTFGANQDITERKRAEEERARLETRLFHAEKMETIGTLVGGIAHDFNNILGIIVGNAELAMDDIPVSNPVVYNIGEIKKAGLRARGIVRQLLAFGRLVHTRKQPVHLTEVVGNSLEFLRPTIPTTIDIRSDFKAKEDVVMADPGQIRQAATNLFVNAAQEMETTGGVLSVEVENETLNADGANTHPNLSCGRYVKIVVKDTGSGIDPEIRDRIFDPYFTTKEVGKGSGLGLAVVLGIVENHGGAVSVESRPGNGTAFSILLPLWAEEEILETETGESTRR